MSSGDWSSDVGPADLSWGAGRTVRRRGARRATRAGHPQRVRRPCGEVSMRRVFSTLMAILSIALLAPKVAGQCTMTHTAVDGGYIFCAVGGSDWTWTGPDGFTVCPICVMASTPGTYTVRVFDGFNGVWSDPCSFTFDALPTGPDCAITGADSVCSGSSTNWCAQSGNYVN